MIDVRLPQYGMGMQEGKVLRWLKRVGDPVRAGELLAEVEAEKSTEELLAPEDGVLVEIMVDEGLPVPVNELLARLAAPGPSVDVTVASSPVVVAADQATEVDRRPVAPIVGGPADRRSGPGRRAITPRARAVAKELGIDLGAVVGTGPDGRVGEDDVRAATGRFDEDPPTRPDGSPMTPMRRMIAERMLSSLLGMAQLTLVSTADITELVAYRAGLEAAARPSYTDFLVRATAQALLEHPHVNSTLDGTTVVRHDSVHVGVATARPEGLVVPVIRDAHRKSLREIARETGPLIARARRGRLGARDLTGSTFTVTSLGAYGIDAFTPIINPPEAAILGVGRIVDQAARDGDGLQWRKVVTMSLTIDHRILDGAPGAAFLARIVALLGDPAGLDGPAAAGPLGRSTPTLADQQGSGRRR